MAHGRRPRGRGVSDSQRRKKTWNQIKELSAVGSGQAPGFHTNFELSVTPGAVTGIGVRDGFILATGVGTGVSPIVSSLPEECTILRIRGSLVFPKYIVGAGAGAVDCSFGMGVSGISDLDSNSYPAPISDADWDGWMFKRAGAVSPVDPTGAIVDVKAMRKIKSGDAFFVQVEAVPESTTSTAALFWQFDLRLLVLLP